MATGYIDDAGGQGRTFLQVQRGGNILGGAEVVNDCEREPPRRS